MKKSYVPIAAVAILALAACEEPDGSPTAAEDVPAPTTETPTPPASEQDAAEAAPEENTADAASPAVCVGSGPQTPRDISSTAGSNPVTFALAPAATE